jgi:hypothetical protein
LGFSYKIKKPLETGVSFSSVPPEKPIKEEIDECPR